MDGFTICQEYLLCSLNEKGKFPTFDLYSPAYFLMAGGLLDLTFSKSITVDENKYIQITGELKEEYQQLAPLYHSIKESMSKTLSDFAQENSDMSGKMMKELMDSIGSSLVEKQCAEAVTKGGVMGKKTYYIPNTEATERIVQTIRTELLEDGVISYNTIALVSLLDKSGRIKRFFSNYEKNQLINRLKEIQSTPSGTLVKEVIDAADELFALLVVVTSIV